MKVIEKHFNGNASSRGGQKIIGVCLHIAQTANGGIQALHNWAVNPNNGGSWHYGVSKKGEIFHYVPNELAAWTQGLSWRNGVPYNARGIKLDINRLGKIIREKKGINPNAYCVTPDTKILLTDMNWIPANKLSVGTEIVGFDENPIKISKEAKNTRRYLRVATVTELTRKNADVYEIVLSDGTKLKSTGEHKWIYHAGKGHGGRWIQTDEMEEFMHSYKNKNGLWLPRYFYPSIRIDSYETGFLSAAFDGEGSFRFTQGEGLQIVFSQKDNRFMEKVKQCLTKLGFKFGITTDKKNCNQLYLTGGKSEVFRFLCECNPRRLMDKFKKQIFGRLNLFPLSLVEVESVRNIGKQEIIAFSSSTKTYIAEGFGSHNTIGVEHEGNTAEKWTTAMYKADAELIKYLSKTYGFPIDRDHVIGHFEIDYVDRPNCLPVEETYLLTPGGWKLLKNVTLSDTVLQSNDNGTLTWTKPTRIVAPYMDRVYKNDIGFMATESHEVLYYDYEYRLFKKSLKHLLDKTVNVPIWGNIQQSGLDINADLLALLVYVQADGHYGLSKARKDGSKIVEVIEFHLKKKRKIKAIEKILNGLKKKFTHRKQKDDSIKIRIRGQEWIRENILKWMPEKTWTWEFLKINLYQWEIIKSHLFNADGYRHKTHRKYCSTVKINNEVLQAIAHTHGDVFSITCDEREKSNHNDAYVSQLYLYKNKSKTLHRNKWKYENGVLVGCVTVPDGNIIIRQNDNIFITGNCPGTGLNWKTLFTYLKPVVPDNLYRVSKNGKQLGAYSKRTNAFDKFVDSGADKVTYNGANITSEFKADMNKLNQKINELTAEKEACVKEKNELIGETNRLKTQIDTQTEQIANFEVKVADLTTSVGELETQVAELKEELENCENCQPYKDEVEKYKQELQKPLYKIVEAIYKFLDK